MQPITNSKRRWMEFCDLLAGVAFPFMILIIFSSTIIVFGTASEGGLPLQIVITVVGELMCIGALVAFGRQNGIVAYKKTVSNQTARQKGVADISAQYGIGEYAPFKGYLIGLLTASMFLLLQTIECIVHVNVLYFILAYACGWAVQPFTLAGFAPSSPIHYVMLIVPVVASGLGYMWGGKQEQKRHLALQKANEVAKKKGGKK